ncbi:MAG: cytochrome b [Parvibaculum sp.]|uniref:cytochrome b n=1 Tax=Parvibaculum sp. TaxID=2024848 RepID=UPI00283B0FF9|nr:cytochrome b [Parvibaculum sp.]MDR3498031.1 cytochrome b [Parvibaculum sp.]
MTEAGSSNSSYSGVAKAFHWIIVVLIAAMLYGAWTIDSVPKPDRLAVMQKHAGIGIIILILMASRLAWRLRHPAPALPSGMPRWQEIASKATHHGLYFLVILQPLLGLALTTTSKFNLKPFGLFGLQIAQNDTIHHTAEVLHGLNAYLIAALIVLHIGAALYHHFILRDNVLKRMLPFVKA